jgi:cobalt-zinc-cadmium efflux system protein
MGHHRAHGPHHHHAGHRQTDRHGHAGHRHGPERADERRVFWVLLLTGGFMVAEVVGGLLSGSLALLADAAHMLTDAGALALAWFALRLANRPADPKRSFGYHRFQVLAAFVNGAALIVITGWILVEAVKRLYAPVEVLGGTMLVVAALGLGVNLAGFAILHGGNRENLNMRGALLHVLGDLLGSVAAIVAAGVILITGWTPIDPILSVAVALLILRGAWDLVSRASHLLMEGAPEGFDAGEIKADLATAVPGVVEIHHVHLWALTPERPLVTLHARIEAEADHDEVLALVQHRLADRFGLRHATVQVERGEHAKTSAGPEGRCQP